MLAGAFAVLAAAGGVLIVLLGAAWIVEIKTRGGDAALVGVSAVPFACCLWATWRLGAYAWRGDRGESAALSFGVASVVYLLLGGMLSFGLLAVWQTVLTFRILAGLGIAAAVRRLWTRARRN